MERSFEEIVVLASVVVNHLRPSLEVACQLFLKGSQKSLQPSHVDRDRSTLLLVMEEEGVDQEWNTFINFCKNIRKRVSSYMNLKIVKFLM